MNKGYNEFDKNKKTLFRRPPQVKSSKAEIMAKYHKIPEIKFEDQQLTSFSGLLVFQLLFNRLNLKKRLKNCFVTLQVSPIFGRHLVVLLLVVHLLLGYRRLREVDYYRDDPLVLRLLGLRKLPDVSTISRALSSLEHDSVENVRHLSRSMVLETLKRLNLPRVTTDFDGSVLSSKGHAEGTAVGYNKNKKGTRSYYPLFATVAQTGQFLDMHHRPGNVHDSNGAEQFMFECITNIRRELPRTVLESRIDSAFFNQIILNELDCDGVRFTASVPFERFPLLKDMIQQRQRWRPFDQNLAFFETNWKPKSWCSSYRFIFIRKKALKQRKGPLQLHLFEPRDFLYDYKVIVTNKTDSAKSIVLFHNGRGSQEAIFGDAKNHAGLEVLPSRRLAGNQMFTLCAMMAHNLSREIQMLAGNPTLRAQPKRPALWTFQTLDTLRHRIIQRAGRLTRPQGNLTLTMSTNQAVRDNLMHFIEKLKSAA